MNYFSVALLTTWLALTAAVTQETKTEFDHEHNKFTVLLRAYVQDNLVDYRKLSANRTELDAYLEELEGTPKKTFNAWAKTERLTFLINLYNAATLRLIIDNYPVESIKDIGGFFKSPWKLDSVSLFGEPATLDTIEHTIIRKNYLDPRVHFALVCAAKGCPPLRNEAYQASSLDEQLDDQGRQFLANTAKNRLDVQNKRLYLSPIFKWFKDDFTKDGSLQDSLQDFVRRYFPRNAAEALSKAQYQIIYTDYDWKLNTQ